MRTYKQTTAISIMLAITIIAGCKTKFNTTTANYTAASSASAIERGKVLVYSSCGGCHYNRADGKFSGTRLEDAPSIIGTVYSANLTNSRSNGIPPRYSDAELKYLLKTGIKKDGHYVPYMLRPNMAEEDLNDIIAYLRSDDTAVAAVDTTFGITKLSLIGKPAMAMMAKPLPYNTGVKMPPENDSIARGYYLVDNMGCFHCHSKSLTSLNYLQPNLSKGYMAGGAKYKKPSGEKIYAANLTPDKQTGIGNYTKSQFRKAVREGESPTGKLHPPMPKFDRLNDREVDAIYAYLQSIPAEYHKVKGH
ncbi:MAG: c-type cytochrome [Mucilaginibacter sp.]